MRQISCEEDVERWGLIASAVAGRSLKVVPARGGVTFTDGDVVYLGDRAGLDSVVVQAALLAAGSLDPAAVRRLVGRRVGRSRYVTLEARRAFRELHDIVPDGTHARVETLWDGPITDTVEASLQLAEDPAVPGAPAWIGVIRPLMILRLTGLEAFAAQDRPESESQSKRGEEPSEADDDPEQQRVEDMSSSSFSTSLTSKLAAMLGMGRASRAGMGGSGQELSMVGDRVGQPSARARRAAAPEWLKVHTGTDYPLGRRYHEWSVEQNDYLPDHCAVAEFDPRVAADTVPLVPRPDLRLRSRLARLGLADEVYRAQTDGDVLDITGLVEFAVDLRVGAPGEARIYERRKRTGHDLGALVLLDSTGSTGQSTNGQQVFAAQRELAGRLACVLEELGDRVALYGFHSMGREDVRFLRVKTFDDRFGHAARRRLGALRPTGFTRLGAAVRHAAHLLVEDAGTSQLLLVVVGDGLPYEQGYDERHAQEDTRCALSEAIASGVGCACISLRSTTHDDVIERVWGHVAHRRLASPDELVEHVQPVFRHALKEAAASRRPQRRTA